MCIYNLFQKINKLPYFPTGARWKSCFPNPKPHVSFCPAFSVLEFGAGRELMRRQDNWVEGVLLYLGGARETFIDVMDSKGSFPTERGQQASEKGEI